MKIEETYNNCVTDGIIKFRKDIDIELIKALLESSIEGKKRLEMSLNNYEDKTGNYSFLFTEKYDILRKLIDAFLLFDKLNCSNHQCTNAYLCTKHKKLEFDWETLETMRMVRNNVNYKGQIVKKEVWQSFNLKFNIYISSLINIVKKKLDKN